MVPTRPPSLPPAGRARALALALSLCGAALAIPGPVRASQAPPGGLQVIPARLEQDLTGRRVAVEVAFRNNGDVPVAVAFELAGLGHDLDGAPLFPADSPVLGQLRLDTAGATVAPGATRRVRVSGQIPAGSGGAYAGVLATVSPPPAVAGGVSVRQRLAGLLLLRGPKPWHEALAVEAVAARPLEGERTVQVFAQVRNTGNVHVRPKGRVDVVHEGRLLETVELRPEVVIPGYARRVGGPWTVPAGLDGPVELRATVEEPVAASGTGTVTFGAGRLVVPPGADLGTPPPQGASLDAGAGAPASRGDTGRVLLSALGAVLLLALIAVLALVARRGRAGEA